MSQLRGFVPPGTDRVCCDGPPLEELSGGNWMAVVDGRSLTGAVRSPVGRVSLSLERPSLPGSKLTSILPSGGGFAPRSRLAGALAPPPTRPAR